MKKLFITLLASIFLVSFTSAQEHLFLEEQVIQLEDSRFSAWVFPVAHDLDLALGDFQAYCKDRSDVKLKKDGEYIMFGEKLSIPSIATKRGDLIGKGFITETYYGVALVFKLGYDISLNSVDWEPEMKNFRNYAKEFMSYHYEKSFARRVDGVEKQISELEKETKQTLNNIDSDNKKIQNLDKKILKESDEAKIEQFKAEIAANEMEIETLSASATDLQDQIDTLKAEIVEINGELHSLQTNIASF
jgi:prefoldin subunit 5